MKKLSSLLFMLCLALPGYALANHDGMGDHCQRHGGKHMSHMKDADKNGDGFIDKEEAKAMHEKHFDEMDANHDGKLDKEEIAACKHDGKMGGMHDKGSKQFDAADKDHDGTLDKEEAKKLPRVSKNFDAIDVDHDGTVDRDEVHNFMKDHMRK